MKTSELHTLKSILEDGIKIEGNEKPIEISCICIPKIQRAYAQGRNKESEVRKDFLDALFAVLTSQEERSIELSFLFGSKQIVAKKSTEGFELLDGQQRTTTLFLLYWYVSLKEQGCVPGFLSKFTYETRDTSTQFLANITSKDAKISINGDTLPSVAIKSHKWFTDDYYCDPTVCAMLTMLDSIDGLYRKLHCSNIFDKLERLKFYVLMLEKFDMNDELYIKMNSRGLSLIPFENFKASLVKYMKSDDRKGFYGSEDVDENGNPPFWFTFISKMDAEWIDIFWKYNPPEAEKELECKDIIDIDDYLIGIRYFNFINRYLFTKAALVDDLPNGNVGSLTSFFYKNVESDEMKQRLSGWELYDQIFRKYESSAKLQDSIFCQMQNVLDTFHDYKDDIEKSIQGDPYGRTTGFTVEAEKFNNFYERVAFAAVTEFIENTPGGYSFADEIVQTNFRRMFRVVFNIIENTLIESAEAAVRVIKMFHAMISAKGAINDNFYRALATTTFKSENRQLREEILKAKEMFSEAECITFIPEWESVFIKAELHPFFKGSVRFFFTEKSGDSAAFDARYNVMKGLFDASGITQEYRVNHILFRAMLSQLNTWKTFGDRYITENAGHEKYLKNLIIGQDAIRNLFCNYFDNNVQGPIENYFKDIISYAQPDNNESQEFKLIYKRLVTDDTSVYLLDWVKDREKEKGQFYIQENRSSLAINIPYKRNDRMILGTERHLIIPELVNEYNFDYDDPNQGAMMNSNIKDSFGWDISISKKINDFTVRLVFNTWKWLDIYIYSKDIDHLSEIFSVRAERKHKDYVQLDSVPYLMKEDIESIRKKINSVIDSLSANK